MAAGLTDHIWTVKELLTTVLVPLASNTSSGDDLQKSRMIISSVRIRLCSFSPGFGSWLKNGTTCLLFQPSSFLLATSNSGHWLVIDGQSHGRQSFSHPLLTVKTLNLKFHQCWPDYPLGTIWVLTPSPLRTISSAVGKSSRGRVVV